MEIKEFISSGLIEMYCMGLASEEETRLVEDFASKHPEVREEIYSVYELLNQYAFASSKSPSPQIKNRIINHIINSKNKKPSFPPRLTLSSKSSDWLKYISDNNISVPESFDTIHLVDLPGDEKQVTYLVWAQKGAVVEESHESEDEYLLMLKGHCSVTINGDKKLYKEGDVVYIPANAVHRAEALSDDIMILVGQRIAA